MSQEPATIENPLIAYFCIFDVLCLSYLSHDLGVTDDSKRKSIESGRISELGGTLKTTSMDLGRMWELGGTAQGSL